MGFVILAGICYAEIMDPDLRRGDDAGACELNLTPMGLRRDDELFFACPLPPAWPTSYRTSS